MRKGLSWSAFGTISRQRSKMAWKREEAAAAEGIWDMEELRIICLQVRVGTLGRWRTLPHDQASQRGIGERRCKRDDRREDRRAEKLG